MSKLFHVTLFFVLLFVSMTGRAEKTYPAASPGNSASLQLTPFPSIARALATESERDDVPVLTERDGEEEEQDDGDGEELDEGVLREAPPFLEGWRSQIRRRTRSAKLPHLHAQALAETAGWRSRRDRPPRV
jgi:hypothetical protein